MIFSATAISLKLFGLVSLAFGRRPEQTPTDAYENVAVSLILDEWCRRSATNRDDPKSYAIIDRIVALRAEGKTVAEVRSELFLETSDDNASQRDICKNSIL